MYKNYTKHMEVPIWYVPKIWLIMRLTTVILIASFLQVSATGFAQKITLSKSNAQLKSVFKDLRNQSGYVFLYTDNQLQMAKPVNIKVNSEDFQVVLQQIFEKQPLTYTINEKTITIKEKEAPSFIQKIKDYFLNIDVSGRVVDERGNAIAGATVKVKGIGVATSTNESGSFILKNVDDKALLEVSYLGYQTRELKAAVDLGTVRLEVEVGKLEEVTINAGYYQVKEREVTGSISRISAKDIETQSVTNLLATMQGRMAGVSIVQESGVPGAGFDLKIRGTNSLRAGGNNPLYIIDGVPYASTSMSDGNIAATIIPAANVSPLSAINPADIESIEVLKDADATAIYGSRGANGVILITTKKGKEGKTKLTFTSDQSFGMVSRYMDLMNTSEYLEMRKEAFANDGILNYPAAAYDVNGKWDQNRYTDWQKELTGGTSKINEFHASVGGGSNLTQFLMSGNYHQETTVYKGDAKYIRGSAILSLNHRSLNNKFNLSASLAYSAQDNNLPSTDLTSESRNLAPNAPAIYNSNGTLNWENGTFNNPLRERDAKYKALTGSLIASTLFSYQILPSLVLRTSLGITDLQYDESRTSPSTIYNPSLGLGPESSSLFANTSSRKSWIIEPQINWSKQIGAGRFEVLLGSTFQRQQSSQLIQEGDGFSSNGLINDLASASFLFTFTNQKVDYKYQSFFSRINFTMLDRYIINLTGRRDGSSRFGSGNQFAKFGAVGLAWLFSKENLFKNSTTLSSGKLRASYGIAGNDQIGDYGFLDTYSSAGNNYQGVVGLQPSRLFNPNFRWELNKKIELAMELGLLKDRIFLTSAYYLNRSTNQLVGIPLPGVTGFTSITANLDATVQNTGFELTLRTENIKKSNFSWVTDFNLTVPRNKLVSFPQLNNSTYANQYVIGQSVNIQKVYSFTGLNNQTGIYQFLDVNNDGRISSPDDRQTVKDFSPIFFGGLQNQLSLKGWQLDFLLQFVKQENWNSINMLGLPGGMANKTVDVLNRWQKIGDTGPYQKYSTGTNAQVSTANGFYTNSDMAISDASYIRLKNISLSYELPDRFLKGIKSRISLNGQNILTITSYKGADPEFRVSRFLPPLKVYSIKLQLNF